MITLVTGGQRSGKSTFAEKILRDKKNVGYIATAMADGSEMEERIRIHRASRPSTWTTIERYKDFADNLGDEDFYILECVGTMTSNILYEKTKDLENIDSILASKIEEEIFAHLSQLIVQVRKSDKDLVIVTNEVGLSLTPLNQVARLYTDILGRINQRLATLSDRVYLIVAGIDMRIK